MTSNYADVQAQLRQAGLTGPRVDVLETGRLVRTAVEGDREQRGWYRLHEIRGILGGLDHRSGHPLHGNG